MLYKKMKSGVVGGQTKRGPASVNHLGRYLTKLRLNIYIYLCLVLKIGFVNRIGSF